MEWYQAGDYGQVFLIQRFNILYISDALLDMGFANLRAMPKCCGDDNLTLFYEDPGDRVILGLKRRLNEFFRAGIEEEDFVITRSPYHVFAEQACFPPGTDFSYA